MKSSAKREPSTATPHVNVTPLIDVLLVLMIIFMVLTPLKPSRFKASIPQPASDNPEERKSPRTLVVDVGTDKKLKLIRGEQLVAEGSIDDSGAVAARLADEFRQRKAGNVWKVGLENRPDILPDDRIERTVFVKAPRSIGYGEVAKVIDGIKGAGAQPVGLQTEELNQ